MKKNMYYFFVFFLFLLLLSGCARWGGDNPLGITGGSKDGYGQNNDLILTDSTAERTIDPELLGNWVFTQGQQSLTELTFYSDGDFTLYSGYPDYQYMTGSFYTSGNTITLIIADEEYTSNYAIRNDRLTITINGVRMVFTRAVPIMDN